jgi:ADP-ribose pyrophosphatase
MLKHWKKLSSKVVIENPWWTYLLDQFQIPDGITGEYNYVHTNGSSMVIPVTSEGKIILVNQYRYLLDKESIELPCGGVKKGKTNEEMAHIELEEETGYRSEELTYVASFNPFNVVTDELCNVYLAKNLVKSVSKPDATEEFELLYKFPSEVDDLIRANVIWDGMTMAAWTLVRHHLKD